MWHELDLEMTQAEAIQAAHVQAMKDDRNVITVGEGVRDPRGLFGTTHGLVDQFGMERVMNMPISEAGVTGICTGAAMMGMRPIVVFQSADYFLIAFDQLVNHTVRFAQLLRPQHSLPIVFRVVIGQNWLTGPQCFQTVHNLFSQIQGLRVVMPVYPKDAKGMLLQAVEDTGPVVMLEHCWLYSLKGSVPSRRYTLPLDKANIVRQGAHVTVAAFSIAVLQAIRAANVLTLQGIELEVIDMRSAQPLDVRTVLSSIRKTGRLMVIDSGIGDNVLAAELITQVSELGFDLLQRPPIRIDSARQPVAFENAEEEANLDNDSMEIAKAALSLVNRNNKVSIDRLAELLYPGQQRDPNAVRL